MGKKVVLISTGGTIASVRSSDGRAIAGQLTGAELLKEVKISGIDVELCSLIQKPSNALDSDDLVAIFEACRRYEESKAVDGIVITHGTDTLEDTAFFLECLLETSDCAVVVTGAQRTPYAIGSDSYTNLADAIVAAASDDLKNCGVTVAFNSALYAAGLVRKVSTYRVDGFSAPGYGPFGYVDGRRAVVVSRPNRLPRLTLGRMLPTVYTIGAALGMDGAAVAALLALKPAGLILDALGRGHVPPSWMKPVAAGVKNGVTIAVTSQCFHGPIAESYEFPGSLANLESVGVIPAKNISARKARLRLMIALSMAEQEQHLNTLYGTWE